MLHYFGGRYLPLNMFKEMLEKFTLNKMFFCRISYLIAKTVMSIYAVHTEGKGSCV